MDLVFRTTKPNFWPQTTFPIVNRIVQVNNFHSNEHRTSISTFIDPIESNHDERRRNSPSETNSFKRSFSQVDHQTSMNVKRSSSSKSISHQTDDDDDDDDDDDSNSTHQTSKTKRNDHQRRAAHTAAEQKRRNAIRKGYDALQSLVPNNHLLDPVSSQKVSKAAILKRSIDYLQQLNDEKQRLENQLETKRREIFCLKAVQKTYEDMIETNLKLNQRLNKTIDDQQKFRTFQKIADELFLSFAQSMQTSPMNDFHEFTSTIIRWIEDSCRPTETNEIFRRALAK